jgi:hypothetical protein
LAENDNVQYDGNTFGMGMHGQLDPALINIPLLTAGTYYLQVSSAAPMGNGGTYALIFGVSDMAIVPEPSSFALATVGLLAFGAIFYRRKRTVINEAR